MIQVHYQESPEKRPPKGEDVSRTSKDEIDSMIQESLEKWPLPTWAPKGEDVPLTSKDEVDSMFQGIRRPTWAPKGEDVSLTWKDTMATTATTYTIDTNDTNDANTTTGIIIPESKPACS